MNKMTPFTQASVVAKQPVKPCHDCPFARQAIPEWLGPHDAHTWLALAHGEGMAECHATKGPCNEHYECAGLAIYRRNVCKVIKEPGLRVETDTELVFGSPKEFAEHHGEQFDPVRVVKARLEIL